MCFPDGHIFTPIIRYNLMIMLFFAFLKVEIKQDALQPLHWKILLANITIPLLTYLLLFQFSMTLALAGFIIAITPTAAASPVIATFLKCRIEFVTVSVLLTSPVIALLLPFLLPQLLAVGDAPIPVLDLLNPILLIVILPFIISLTLKRWFRRIAEWLQPLGRFSFYLFVLNVYIASAKSTHFIISNEDTPWGTILGVALVSFCLCLLQFQLGERMANTRIHPWESSLALGRKNTMLAIWIALTYIDPIVAMSPMFYIIFQNAYNSWQMFQLSRKEKQLMVGN